MLENLLVPINCERRITMHVLVYSCFVRNVENNSSVNSLEEFLSAVFEPVGESFYSEFGVGLDICYISQELIDSVVKDPPVREEEKEEVRHIYSISNREEQISLSTIMYDFSLKNEEKTPFCFGNGR